MKPKAYLVSIGALPPGSENVRGRISLEHKQLIEKAVAAGTAIDGFAVTPTKGAVSSPENTEVKRVPVSNEKVISQLPEDRYPEDTHKAYTFENGGKTYRSLREACRQTGVSLVVCPCNAHEIVALDATASVRVYIERK